MERAHEEPAADEVEETETLTSRVLAAADDQRIPIRTILATVGVVIAAGLVLVIAWVLRTDLLLLAAALFITVLLAQPVAFVERRLGMRRSVATSVVFGLGVLIFLGIAFLLGYPLVTHVTTFAKDLPRLVSQAQHGRGWLGRLITRLHLHNWVVKNAPKLDDAAKHLAGPALSFGGAALTTIIKLLTIAFLAFFLLLDLPKIWKGLLSLLPEQRAARVSQVAHEASTGVSGYMVGNALTSIIAGVVVFVSLVLFHVPFAGLLALWVALVDFIPIVGALLAGVPTVFVAFLHSPAAGIGVLVIFLVYQQVENHVLNPIVMAKTVKMSPLWNLIAVVVGATLGGRIGGTFGTFIGALVGIPVGSALQVIVREIRHPSAAATEDDTAPS